MRSAAEANIARPMASAIQGDVFMAFEFIGYLIAYGEFWPGPERFAKLGYGEKHVTKTTAVAFSPETVESRPESIDRQ